MREVIRKCVVLGFGVVCAGTAWSCDSMSTLGGTGLNTPAAAAGDNGGDDTGGHSDGGVGGGEGGANNCPYTDDAQYCKCLQYDCGGASTISDNGNINRAVYCGTCPSDQYCRTTTDQPGIGTCGGKNALLPYQRQKIDILEAMGENDKMNVAYGFISNENDGRGYTIGKVGFCTGTGDFIIVAACYNDLKPGNVLQKYWGTRTGAGKALDGLIYYNDQYIATGKNQADTSKLDSLGDFQSDVVAAAAEPDGIFRKCQDTLADALYLSPALKHAEERGLSAMSVGFLYDMELNFGEDDDQAAKTPGVKTIMATADKDYGSGLPTSFIDKPWEESRWLGFVIKERTITMSKNDTWKSDMDQNATWEAARRLNTGKSNNPETDTKVNMDIDFVSAYKAGSTKAGTPCWPTGLVATDDTNATVYTVSTDKTASATDDTQWLATAHATTGGFKPCPDNPTP